MRTWSMMGFMASRLRKGRPSLRKLVMATFTGCASFKAAEMRAMLSCSARCSGDLPTCTGGCVCVW